MKLQLQGTPKQPIPLPSEERKWRDPKAHALMSHLLPIKLWLQGPALDLDLSLHFPFKNYTSFPQLYWDIIDI